MDKAVQNKKFINADEQIQQRTAFEAWAIEQKIAWRDKQHGLCFYDGNGKSYWLGYQAGRAAIALDRQGRGEAVAGERFLRAWVNLDKLPGTMMVGPEGRFGPIAASTSCWITTSEREAERLKAKGPVLEIWTTPQPANPAVKDSLTVAEPVNHAIRIYNSGYMAGHQDTVEGCFTEILSADMASYHEDVVSELVDDLRDHQPPSGEGALYDAGWSNAALWADRSDLMADIGSAAYDSAKSIAMRKLTAIEVFECDQNVIL